MDPDFTMGQSAAPDVSLMQAAVYAAAGMFGAIVFLTLLACFTQPIYFAAMGSLSLGLKVVQNFPDPIGKYSKIGGLVFRSLRRNLLRTALTYVALFVLTGMLTLIYGVVKSIGKLTAEKEDSQMVIMSDKFSIPSQMPPGIRPKSAGLP